MIAKNKKELFSSVNLYIIFWAYFFVQVMKGFTQTTLVSGSRLLLLLVLLVCGYLIKKNRFRRDPITTSSSLFGGYLSLMALLDLGLNYNGLSNIFSVFLWVIVFRQISYMKIDDNKLHMISLIMSVMCNLLSYIYIFDILPQIKYMENVTRIGAINSIYYILISFPFIFLFRNWLWSMLFSILPLLAFITSGKTTCMLCGSAIVLYYIIHNFRSLRFYSRILFVIVVYVIGCFAAKYVDFSSLLYSTQDDFSSGGNGRFEIFSKVSDLLMYESDFSSIIFGHGVNAISRTIGIGGHNDFLEVFYCYGIVGLLSFIIFLANLVRGISLLENKTIRTSYVISLISLLFALLASKLIATQIGLLPLSIFWGILFANNRCHKKNKCIYENSSYNSVSSSNTCS